MFVLALILLSLILRKAKAAYEFSESKEKINHILVMDDLKLYSRSEKGLDSLEADKFLEEKMKLNVLKEHIRMLRKV